MARRAPVRCPWRAIQSISLCSFSSEYQRKWKSLSIGIFMPRSLKSINLPSTRATEPAARFAFISLTYYGCCDRRVWTLPLYY